MGIPGITVGVVEQLLMEGKLDTVESLYTLTVKDFMDACHVSYTDAYVLMKSVERSKLKPMHMLLDAMGIPGISREITPALAACITDAGGMGALVDDDPGVTARAVSRFTARSIRVGLPAKAVKQVIDYMVAHRDMVLAFVRMGVAQKSVPLVVEDKPKRSKGRKMKRRKPRKKPGEHGAA
jgi:NAD-dependent DNA ligase